MFLERLPLLWLVADRAPEASTSPWTTWPKQRRCISGSYSLPTKALSAPEALASSRKSSTTTRIGQYAWRGNSFGRQTAGSPSSCCARRPMLWRSWIMNIS